MSKITELGHEVPWQKRWKEGLKEYFRAIGIPPPAILLHENNDKLIRAVFFHIANRPRNNCNNIKINPISHTVLQQKNSENLIRIHSQMETANKGKQAHLSLPRIKKFTIPPKKASLLNKCSSFDLLLNTNNCLPFSEKNCEPPNVFSHRKSMQDYSKYPIKNMLTSSYISKTSIQKIIPPQKTPIEKLLDILVSPSNDEQIKDMLLIRRKSCENKINGGICKKLAQTNYKLSIKEALILIINRKIYNNPLLTHATDEEDFIYLNKFLQEASFNLSKKYFVNDKQQNDDINLLKSSFVSKDEFSDGASNKTSIFMSRTPYQSRRLSESSVKTKNSSPNQNQKLEPSLDIGSQDRRMLFMIKLPLVIKILEKLCMKEGELKNLVTQQCLKLDSHCKIDIIHKNRNEKSNIILNQMRKNSKNKLLAPILEAPQVVNNLQINYNRHKNTLEQKDFNFLLKKTAKFYSEKCNNEFFQAPIQLNLAQNLLTDRQELVPPTFDKNKIDESGSASVRTNYTDENRLSGRLKLIKIAQIKISDPIKVSNEDKKRDNQDVRKNQKYLDAKKNLKNNAKIAKSFNSLTLFGDSDRRNQKKINSIHEVHSNNCLPNVKSFCSQFNSKVEIGGNVDSF